jgi:UDP-4-amino-4-deoxy-L-arabinose formyltransferase/UDP-glucuronic acid dehydrogenase (UDP-4-keto-hexauronic acid decarboxylating)
MMSRAIHQPLKLLVMCTVGTGLDAVAEVLRQGFTVSAIVGVHPDSADPEAISGWTDVAAFARRWGVPYVHVDRYDLKSDRDQQALLSLKSDVIWVAGWQRLIPSWLVEHAPLGAIGVHGSPDGIHGGRGRSPQNWAILLGCRQFEIALFRITPGVDDGPVIATRSFVYLDTDDIAISYKKVALCTGEMMCEVLRHPQVLAHAVPQSKDAYYYPQRRPEDGYADWTLSTAEVWAHCRALTRPYPGLRTRTSDGGELTIWRCQPFDDRVTAPPGTVTAVFEDGAFLVTCMDGRVIVTDSEGDSQSTLSLLGIQLDSISVTSTLGQILDRHMQKHSESQRVAPRVMHRMRSRSVSAT